MELKDKITKEQQVESIKQEVNKNSKTDSKIQDMLKNNAKVSEAIAALQVLGYNKREVEKAFEKIDTKNMTTEELIRKGLAVLGK